MWFTNVHCYTFTKPFETSARELEEQLNENRFRPCGSQDQQKMGWVSAIPNTENLVHLSGNNALIALKTEEKILPTAVIKDALAEKVEQIEAERGQKVGKKEAQTLKEEIIQQLLPKAFTRSNRLYAYIDYTKQRVIVNTSSANKSETLLAMLRQSLGSLPILPFKPEAELIGQMTEWVKTGKLNGQFQFATDIELKSLDDEGAIAKLKNHDVTEDEVQLHINNGKFVHKLGLIWQEKVRFVLNDDATIKQMKFLDIVKEQNEDVGNEDKLARFDADVTLMSAELNEMLNDIIELWS